VNDWMARPWIAGLVAVFFCLPSLIQAETYYVAVNGNDSWDGLTPETAWETLGKANNTLQAGDTVLIRGGNYSTGIEPVNSGSRNSRIVYRNYAGEAPVITGVSTAVSVNTKSYITVQGIAAVRVNMYALLDSCQYVSIQDCRFDSANSTSGWPTGVRIRDHAQFNRITGCTIGRVGYCTADDDKGGIMVIGTWEDANDHCDYNLLENNTIYYGGHHLIELVGRYNVIRNNYFHNEEWMDCSRPGGTCGNRTIVVGYDPVQCRQNLFEGNRFAFSGVPPDQNTSSGMSIRTPYNIVRSNFFYHNDGPGLGISTGRSSPNAQFNHIYHNVFYHNGYTLLSGVEQWKQGGLLVARHGRTLPTTDLSIKNNLFYDNNAADAMVFYYVSRDSQVVANNWEHAGDPLFHDVTSPVDPSDPSLPDFHLQSNSPCIGSGAFLTEVTSATGSGTRFQVDDPYYFMDGWGIIEGDLIQLEGQTQRVRITKIDYTSNTITVDQDLSWTHGQGVSLAYEGSAPDIGAYEYSEGSAIEK